MLSQPLKGQKAVVTGASSGIGEAVALALGAAGAAVLVNYVGASDPAERVVKKIQGSGSDAMAVRADVSRESEVQAMFRQLRDAWGTVDILVNNAGLQQDAPVHEMTLAQ